jgi:hypothetical protein
MTTIYQAITTKYLGPTNYRGARIKAYTESGISLTISYPYELNPEEGHLQAADKLKTQLGWEGKLIQGAIKTGYVFVLVN